jgi:hypothetical protein
VLAAHFRRVCLNVSNPVVGVKLSCITDHLHGVAAVDRRDTPVLHLFYLYTEIHN